MASKRIYVRIYGYNDKGEKTGNFYTLKLPRAKANIKGKTFNKYDKNLRRHTIFKQ